MKITDKTRYEDFVPFERCLDDESEKLLKDKAEEQFGYCSQLTIDEFFGINAGDLSILGDMSDPSVLQVYWCKRFKEFVEQFTDTCERLTLKATQDEEKAKVGCVDISPLEGVLIFTRSYFGLPSFTEAGKRTLGEYITARKDEYNRLLMRRNYDEAQKAKLTKHKK